MEIIFRVDFAFILDLKYEMLEKSHTVKANDHIKQCKITSMIVLKFFVKQPN